MFVVDIICLLDYRYSHFFFFFNDTATTEIYTLSLHDALPICTGSLSVAREYLALESGLPSFPPDYTCPVVLRIPLRVRSDRKSTRLNSSHITISYAVFCLKKKTKSTKLRLRPQTKHSAPPTSL